MDRTLTKDQVLEVMGTTLVDCIHTRLQRTTRLGMFAMTLLTMRSVLRSGITELSWSGTWASIG